MKYATILPWIRLFTVSILLTGCAVKYQNPNVPFIHFMPYVPEEFDVEAKRFQAEEGRSNIYVARKNTLLGAAQIYDILLDGDRRRVIGAGTYILYGVSPGSHIVEALAQRNKVSVTIDTYAGENYFVEIKPAELGRAECGMVGSCVSAQQIGEERGRKLVLGGKRVGLVFKKLQKENE